MKALFLMEIHEFDRTLKEYTKYSKKALPDIVNTKALWIARQAINETPMVKVTEVRKALRDLIIQTKRGQGAKLKISSRGSNAPIAALIINKRQGKRGQKGLYGADMDEAIGRLISSRIKGVAFLKSGWIWAIKRLQPLADARGGPRTDRRAKAYGKAKGGATPATDGWRVAAEIINKVTAHWDTRDIAASKAEPALQRAFDFETKSMLDYISKKLKEAAHKAGIKTD